MAFLSQVDRAIPRPAEVPSVEAIYEEHADFLYALLRRLGLGPTQAEDALQDLFVVVHRRLGSYEGRGSLRSWLYGIALRVAREHRRKRSLRDRLFELFGGGEEREASAEGDPERALLAADRIRRLDGLLSSLSQEKREIFVLVEVAGCTVPEAAETLEIKLNTAYSRLRLAREDVRAKMAHERAEEERRGRR